MSHAKAFKNDPKVMDPVVPTEGFYVIGRTGSTEQIASLVSGLTYFNGLPPTVTVNGLIVGNAYYWSPGANDTNVIYGPAAIEPNGVYVPAPTLTAAGEFIAQETSVTLTGTANTAVTCELIPARVFCQKILLYGGKMVGGPPVWTANGANAQVGRGGLGSPIVPDTLYAAGFGTPIGYDLPAGQKMDLGQIVIQGTAGDGVFYSFT